MSASEPGLLQVRPTGRGLGAEIVGVDLSQPLPAELVLALEAAWTRHLVLLFRNQALSEAQHVAAARIFGQTQVSGNKVYYQRAGLREVLEAGLPEISVIHNLDGDGRVVQENSALGSGRVDWHSDNSYMDVPPAGSMLVPRVLPSCGGQTLFSNQYEAYARLPEELKRISRGRTAVHDTSRDGAGRARPGLSVPTSPKDVPGPHHPLVIRHPVSGLPALYLGRRRAWPSGAIDGLEEQESCRALALLWEFATHPDIT